MGPSVGDTGKTGGMPITPGWGAGAFQGDAAGIYVVLLIANTGKKVNSGGTYEDNLGASGKKLARGGPALDNRGGRGPIRHGLQGKGGT